MESMIRSVKGTLRRTVTGDDIGSDGKMKIALLMPSFFEQLIGGSEYMAYLLAEAAKRRGHEVHYLFAATDAKYENHLGIHLHPMKRMNVPHRFGSTWFLYRRRIVSILRQIQPDLLYVRSGVSWAGTAARYAKESGSKSVWHVASSADVTPKSFLSLAKRPLDVIERRAIEYAIYHSTHVVAHARFLSDLLMKNYARHSQVILKEQPEPEEALDKSGPCTVVWVANIKPLKQPEMFVRLAREFAGNREVRFIMIGRPSGGRYQDELGAQIRALPNITYMREQPIQEVNRVLARSHVFVNTSTYEGLPNTFVQAWMREVPVVSMHVNPDDILTTLKIGYLSGSFAQMVQDVGRLIENAALRNDMGARAREYALKNHSLEKNMGRLLDLIGA